MFRRRKDQLQVFLVHPGGPVPGELLFTLIYIVTSQTPAYVHRLNVADFKGIRAG
jgi:hypothetical protein